MSRWWGWFFGLDGVTSIDEIEVELAAPWAQEGPFWVFLAVIGLAVLAVYFYLRLQPGPKVPARWALAVCRGLLLALLLITLADPVLRMHVTRRHKPQVYVVFDGTDSMAIADQFPETQRSALVSATGWKPSAGTNAIESPVAANGQPTRLEYVKSWLKKADDNTLARLQDKNNLEIEAFLFDGNTTSQLRKLGESSHQFDRKLDPAALADQLTHTGQVTALGAVLQETSQQFGSGRLAGVVLVSDFAHNAGASPVGLNENSPIARLGVPVYAVGVGATEAIDLAVELQTDPKMKKAERSKITAKLRQSGLLGQNVTVRVTGRKIGGDSATSSEFQIGQKTVTFQSGVAIAEIDFTPEESGNFRFTATVDPIEGEIVAQNNHAQHEVNVIEDYLRLMYVAHEPTWEWRFIKEVFHRDKLVGMDGFRTFLASSDPRVRDSNVLFLSTLTPKRSEFFANDVMFIDDMPRGELKDRYCEMVKEFVTKHGGGLVIICGPRFGPRELQQTPLADLLPVIVDPQAEMRDAPEYPEFRLKLTPYAANYPFMHLGNSEGESQRAWDNLGKLPWYQPVSAKHPLATVLAEHPTDKCRDGKTPQPLISIREFGGKGKVVMLSFNETWRLRRKYGEKYYRQFWSQLIYSLGMGHAIGSDKRFVAKIDRQEYRAEDKVQLTVEAYDVNFEPLDEENIADRTLEAEMLIPGAGGGDLRPIRVPMLTKGIFEARIPVVAVGEYVLRVKDPVTNKFSEQRFEVTALSAERRKAVRDEKLQQQIAEKSGGKAYDLTTVHNLVNDLQAEPRIEKMTRNKALWSTPLWFTLVVGLMLTEWLFRKIIRLS